jgi:hypothetical protein
MKLSLIHPAAIRLATAGRWLARRLAPAALAAATLAGSLGVSSVALAQENGFHGRPGPTVPGGGPRGEGGDAWRGRGVGPRGFEHRELVPGPRGVAPAPAWGRRWGREVRPAPLPWRHWRTPGWWGRSHGGGGRGGFHGGGGRGGFHGGGGRGGFHGGHR